MNEHLIQNIHWWEKRRGIYNIILLLSSCGIMILFSEMTKSYGIKEATMGTIGYIVIANIIFSIGWGIPVLAEYYFEKYKWLIKTRMFQFVVGCLFTLFMTLVTYRAELYYAYISTK